MTIQTFRGGYMMPGNWLHNPDPVPSYTALGLDASGEKAAFVFRAPEAGDITDVGIMLRSLVTPTDTDVRIETVDLATGNPTGTLVNAGATVTVASGSLVANAMNWVTLGTPATVTADQYVAIVVAPSGTPNIQVATLIAHWTTTANMFAFPYADHFTAAWAKALGSIFGVRYGATRHIIPHAYPLTSAGTQTVGTDTNPNRIGLRLRMPVRCRVTAVALNWDTDQDGAYEIYDSDGGTVLYTSPTFDKDVRFGDGEARPQWHDIPAADQITLSANTYYRIVVKPSTTGATLGLYSFNVVTAADLDLFHGGQDWHWTQAQNPTGEGSWTQTLTRRPLIWCALDMEDGG